jgi:hypothetical protein
MSEDQAPDRMTPGDALTWLLLWAFVITQLWTLITVSHGGSRLALAVVASRDLDNRRQLTASDVTMRLVAVTPAKRWLADTGLAVGKFVVVPERDAPCRRRVCAGEPLYTSMLSERPVLTPAEKGTVLPIRVAATGTGGAFDVRVGDFVDVWMASAEKKPTAPAARQPADAAATAKQPADGAPKAEAEKPETAPPAAPTPAVPPTRIAENVAVVAVAADGETARRVYLLLPPDRADALTPVLLSAESFKISRR